MATISSPVTQDIDQADAIFGVFKHWIAQQTRLHAGYPYNLNYDYSAVFPFLQYTLNNLGDPFVESNYGIHTREFEQRCVYWLANLYKLDNPWGYVTSCGTEGNLYGLFLGRELHPEGVLFSSKDTHYSVAKAARLYRMPHVVVNSQPSGEIDYDDFEYQLSSRQPESAIVNINLGTTVKGAVDRIDRIVSILDKLKIPFYLHCDGALGGLLLPFIEDAPAINFQDYPIGSIAVSGHKFVGSPVPCGIVLARQEYVKQIETIIEYIGSTDTTIMGSRSGLAPLFMWYAFMTRGKEFAQEVKQCTDHARYLCHALERMGYNPFLNDFSTTVVFDKPETEFCHKWQLATQGELAHVVVMQNHTQEILDTFLKQLLATSSARLTSSFSWSQ